VTYLEDLAAEIEVEVSTRIAPGKRTRSLFVAYAALALAKGTATEASDVHDVWVAWMFARGEHRDSMVPFDELAPEIQREDLPFVEAIRQVASRRTGRRR
jgi:hypothetical protein